MQSTLKSLGNVRKAPEASAGVGVTAAAVEAELTELHTLASNVLNCCKAVEEVSAESGGWGDVDVDASKWPPPIVVLLGA